MQPYQSTDLAKLYGTHHIDKRMPGYESLDEGRKKPRKSNFFVDRMILCLHEKLCVDFVIKELTFAGVALITYLYMQHSGRMASMGSFGHLIEFMLIAAVGFNLFKASIKSLAPGLFCLVGGLVCLSGGIHQHYFKFLTTDNINYIVGFGACLIALSLMRSDNKN